MADQIRIRELTETSVIDDAAFLAVDYKNETYKVSVENFNSNANATAKRYAEQAAASATEASGFADDAEATAAEIELKVTDAQGYATAAADSATNARTYANNAQGYSNSASGYANDANADAQAAAFSADDSEDNATLSRSWAVGGTGARTGEDTNNARYWSDVAASAAGGGVTSFNGRGGAVIPQPGDYTAAMVGAAATGDVYTKAETYSKNEVYSTSQTYPRTTIDTMVANAAAAGVTSFNGRTGAVSPTSGDYTASNVNGTDTNGILGATGRVYSTQALIDEITNRIMNSLVTNSALSQALQSYVTKTMITTLATITNTGTNVLDGTEKNPSVSGSLAAQIKAITDDYLKSSNIYNGLDKTAAGFALDARQGKSLNDSLSNLSTDVSTNYATKTDLSNGYVPQTDSITFPGWDGAYPCRMDATQIMINLPCSSLKNGTLSVVNNTTWNVAAMCDTSGSPNVIVANFTFVVTAIRRISRDYLVLVGAKPSAFPNASCYGVAVNRGQFTISST